MKLLNVLILSIVKSVMSQYLNQEIQEEIMNVDITKGHFILMAALLYNERGASTSEEELRADLSKAAETVRNMPIKDFITMNESE
ncbi:hypothetical protein OAL97_02380 [Paracoccaceae bacterium]|jgi:hypothetical protein|nr:hypothetical protein [Paracoccaceae bacterium]